MKKRFGLAAALATVLTVSAAPAAFANEPCGPFWVDDNGNRVPPYDTDHHAHKNPNNKDDCELTKDNWNYDMGPNIDKTIADSQNQVWNNRTKNTDGSYNPGIGQVNANDPHMADWAKNGRMKTVAEKINEDSDRINNKQDKITSDQITDAKTWVNGQIAKAASGGAIFPTNGMSHFKAADTADAAGTADSINKVIDYLNAAQGTATEARLNTGTNAENIKTNADNIAANKTAIDLKQDKITQKQIDDAQTWVTKQIKAAVDAGGGNCGACDKINKISDTDPDGNLTAKDTTARTGVAENKKAIAQNKSDIATTQKSIGDEDFRKESVQNRLADMNTSIHKDIAATSASDRAYTDSVAVNTLNKANAYTDSRYNQLNGKIDKLRSRIDSGVAGATALASIPFSSITKNSFGGSVSVANSKAAGAVGYQRNFDKHWSARGTVAFGDHYAQGGIGGSFNW